MPKTHGGDIYNNEVKLDFSVNINPLGMPDTVKGAISKAITHCDQYPDPTCAKLKQTLAQEFAVKRYDVTERDILFGNGASELFMAIVHAIRPRRAVIPAPSFSGYEYAMQAVDGEIAYCLLAEADGFDPDLCQDRLAAMLTAETDILFLANPNNPTGKLMSEENLHHLLDHCREQGIFVVMDECFIDFCADAESSLRWVKKHENLIVVQAFTKIYAIPGLRLGYLVCGNESLREKIARNLPEWNVSVIAQEAGATAARARAYVTRTQKYVQRQRAFLEEALTDFGFRVCESSANFILFYTELPLYKMLLKKKILIRDCSNYEGLTQGYYRIAVKREEENRQLLKAMGECIENN